ncbi:MAG: type II secretion system F family protein [Alphaproteobacteria bacterium]|nr:type II secretion system F family protein [Alphaproteobacteria bacterium]
MPSYNYRAVHASGKIQKGFISASNENELILALKNSGHELITAHAQTRSSIFKPRLSSGRLASLCGQIADLLRAGVPLLTAITQVKMALPGNDGMSDCLGAIAFDISHGTSLTEAFSHHPKLFDAVFLALLQAGEKSGDPAATFERLSAHLEWKAQISEQIRRALHYPIFLFLVAGSATCFMMAMVVPQIVDFLASIQENPPLSTRLLIKLSYLFSAGWWILLALPVTAAITIAQIRRHSRTAAELFDKALLFIPFIGPIMRQQAMARFAKSLLLLLQSGTSLPESLRIATGTLQNLSLMNFATYAEEYVGAGRPLSYAFAGLLSPFAVQMLLVGEQSGKLTKALDEITRHYENATKNSVNKFIGSLEPALTMLIGGLLAWVVLAVLGPIYGSLEVIGQAP